MAEQHFLTKGREGVSFGVVSDSDVRVLHEKLVRPWGVTGKTEIISCESLTRAEAQAKWRELVGQGFTKSEDGKIFW